MYSSILVTMSQFNEGDVEGIHSVGLHLDKEGVFVAVVLHHVIIHPHRDPKRERVADKYHGKYVGCVVPLTLFCIS